MIDRSLKYYSVDELFQNGFRVGHRQRIYEARNGRLDLEYIVQKQVFVGRAGTSEP